MTKTILVLGHHELDYPRNVVNQRLVRAAGYDIVLGHSRAFGPLREAALIKACLEHGTKVDAIFLTEGAHRYVPLIKLVAMKTQLPVIFDAFTSRYNTYVEDRKRYSPRSAQAMRCWYLDWSSVRAADFCIFDTAEHRAYFDRRYGLRGHADILEVGVDENVFKRVEVPPSRRAGAGGWERPFEVFCYGTYIPLHGMEHIVDAAARLRVLAPDVHVTIVGNGQTRPAIDRQVAQLDVPNLTLRDPVPVEELARGMADADVCLGIFADTEKAANVVPNKVVQAAAVGRPIITRASTAIERYFVHGESAWLVPPADPDAIAEAILALRDPALRDRLAAGARAVFEREFAESVLARKMQRILDAATSLSGLGLRGRASS